MKDSLNTVENKYSTGAIPKSLDLRDHKVKNLKKVGGASVPFDWTIAPQLEDWIKTQTVPTKDQGQNDSCGPQSTSYYNADLKAVDAGTFVESSAHFIYPKVFVADGGSELRDNFKVVVQQGCATETAFPSYINGQPLSEQTMRDGSGITPAIATEAKTRTNSGYAWAGVDIDSVAQATRDNLRSILLIKEKNNGTWESIAPLPPVAGNLNPVWGHFVIVGHAGWYQGKKAVAIHNSWGNVGLNGWQILTIDHFTAGCIIECGVLYDTNVYSHSPTAVQKSFSWLQLFINWFQSFQH